MKLTPLFVAIILSALCLSCKLDELQETKKEPDPATKLAIISSREILTKCDAGAQVISFIQSKFSERRIQLGLMEQDIRKLQEDTANATEFGPKKKLLQEKLNIYTEAERKLRQEVSQEEAVQFKPVLETVNKILTEYAKEKNISAVQERGTFVYFNRSLDITEIIINRVNLAK